MALPFAQMGGARFPMFVPKRWSPLMKQLSLAAVIVNCSLTLLACDAQVDSDYRGEPLATVQGKIVAGGASNTTDLRAAVLNYNFLSGDFAVVDGQQVVGSFPANFRVDL